MAASPRAPPPPGPGPATGAHRPSGVDGALYARSASAAGSPGGP
ncbi:hypothetical protein [Streptomyces sp. NPDC051636]